MSRGDGEKEESRKGAKTQRVYGDARSGATGSPSKNSGEWNFFASWRLGVMLSASLYVHSGRNNRRITGRTRALSAGIGV
jgi:hypothetical protein